MVIYQIHVIFIHLGVWIAAAIHTPKWIKTRVISWVVGGLKPYLLQRWIIFLIFIFA